MSRNEGPLVLGITIFTLILGGLFILARVIVRTVLKPQFGSDDACIILTWFLILAFNLSYFVAVSHGYGRPSSELALPELLSAARAAVVGEVFAMISYPPGKAAVACLLMRLFPGRKLKVFLWAFVAANTIPACLTVILLLVQCKPVAYMWDKSIPGGSCWDPRIFGGISYIPGVVGTVTDFTFAVVPWYYITKLQMPLRRKITIGAALSMGFLPFVCAVLKMQYTATLGYTDDPTIDTVKLVLAGAAEMCAINIAACVPTLHPLYLWLAGKDPKGNSTGSVPWIPQFRRRDQSSRRIGPFSLILGTMNSKMQTQIDSSENLENQIWQRRSYEVSVETRRASSTGETKVKNATVTAVDAEHCERTA